jgi:hypothetical protein
MFSPTLLLTQGIKNVVVHKKEQHVSVKADAWPTGVRRGVHVVIDTVQ